MSSKSLVFFSVITLLFSSEINLHAQTPPTKYFIQFSDKNNSEYSVNNPAAFLSTRAIQRRQTFLIEIDESDFPPNQFYINGIAQIAGVTIVAKSRWLNGVIVEINDALTLNEINSKPFVVTNKPVFSNENPYDDDKYMLEELDQNTAHKIQDPSNYGVGLNQIDMVGGLGVHNAGFNGSGVLIAVLDAGFRNLNSIPAFTSLLNRGGIKGVINVVNPAVIPTQISSNAHGTNVLGIMAANLSGEFIGTAPEADYLLIRTEDETSENLIEEYFWVIGAELADSAGADVINSSLGYNLFDKTYMNHSFSEMDGNTTVCAIGANKAVEKGIFVVVSAGNEGDDAWKKITTPADATKALAVGATNNVGDYAQFSSIGPSASGAVKPNVVAQGQGTAYTSSEGLILSGNGTSFSAPVISGMVACLRQALPTLPVDSLRQLIEKSAHQFNSPDAFLGYGIPNFSQLLTSLNTNQPTNMQESQLLNLFPNPSSDSISLLYYSADNSSVDVSLYNHLGQMLLNYKESVFKNSVNYLTINQLDYMSEGIYQVKIQSADKVFKSKFFVKH